MVNTKGDIFMYVGPFSHSISCSPLEDLRSETAALADVVAVTRVGPASLRRTRHYKNHIKDSLYLNR